MASHIGKNTTGSHLPAHNVKMYFSGLYVAYQTVSLNDGKLGQSWPFICRINKSNIAAYPAAAVLISIAADLFGFCEKWIILRWLRAGRELYVFVRVKK